MQALAFAGCIDGDASNSAWKYSTSLARTIGTEFSKTSVSEKIFMNRCAVVLSGAGMNGLPGSAAAPRRFPITGA
jgi:hypothetical protein